MKYLVLVLSNLVVLDVRCAEVPEPKIQLQVNGMNFNSSTEYKLNDGDDAVSIICHVEPGIFSTQLTSNAYGVIKTRKNSRDNYLKIKIPQINTFYVECLVEHSYAGSLHSNTRIYFVRNMKQPGTLSPEKNSTSQIMLPKQCEKSEKENSTTYLTGSCVYGAIIGGLEQIKILAMFISNKNTFTTLYECDDEEELRLDCKAKSYEWSWDTTVESKVRGSFKLKPNETTATITCKSNDTGYDITNAEIKLIKKSNNAISSISENENSGDPSRGISDDLGKEYTSTNPEMGNVPGPGLPVIVAIVVCSLVFLVILVFVTIRLFKKKPTPDSDANINYESLSEHNKGAMPIPPQWQEAQYTTPLDRIANNDYAVPFKPTVEEMYASPVPKNQRAEDNQACALNDNLGPTHAQTVPKHPRTGVNVLPIASKSFAQTILKQAGKDVDVLPKGSTYAELSLKQPIAKKSNSKNEGYEKPCEEIAPWESSYVSVNPYEELNSECSYVEVGSESSYSDSDKLQNRKKYVNVFNDPRYVNADGKEYAEPAYCEVNRLKN